MTTLICLQDAYQRTASASVRRCAATDGGGYAVELDRTVLYPESGGQPADHGQLDGQPVKALLRDDGGRLVHLLDSAVTGQVEVSVDWARRFDHMQQHTAQHLLTAVAQDHLGYATTAFHLGRQRSDVELDCAELSADQLRLLELECNREIRFARPVSLRWVQPGQLESLEVRTRGLPRGHRGAVRLVDIEGVDLNTCGGTHVANTAQLQAIKLLATERMRGGTRLFYVAGGRLLGLMECALEQQAALSETLSCGPAEHLAAVQRLQDETRQQRRLLRGGQRELASLLVDGLASSSGVASLHRDESQMEFLRTVGAALHQRDPARWALLTAGRGDDGLFLLVGPDEQLRQAGQAVARILEGKGGGARGLFQGKAARLGRRQQALEQLQAMVAARDS